MGVGLGAWALAGPVRAQDDFTQAISAEERAAAGLDKLSPAELARLKAIVERYKSGEIAVVQRAAEEKVAAVEQAAATKVAAAEARAKESAVDGDKREPGWLKALVTLQRVADKPEAQEALESRFATEFRGWRSNTVFTLENGQRWQVDGTEEYISPPQPAPKVRIRPGVLGAYWMEIEGVRPRVKVKPVKL